MYTQLIEAKIDSLDGGTFQNLCRELVAKEYSSYVHNVGGVLGSNKTSKGHPDVLFRLKDNDKYVFLECGTVKKNIEEKILNDVSLCLNEEITGIPCSKIDKIIYCFSGRKINFANLEKLKEKLAENDIVFFVWGIDTIASMIQNQYPTIAKLWLDIEIPLSKSIYTIDEFIDESENQWSPSLNKIFKHRQDELAQIDSFLQESNILILVGNPGVGKTSLAIEYLKNRKEKALVIKAENGPCLDAIFESSQKANFFIIDDGMMTPLLPRILDSLSGKKVILTVRNYLLDEVDRILSKSHLKFSKLNIRSFQKSEIIDIVSANSDIKNNDLLVQIARISKGNIRLAFMLVESVDKSPAKYDKLYNAREIFADYYNERLHLISDSNDSEPLLKIVGIFSILGKFSLAELKSDKSLLDILGINDDSFDGYIRTLNKQEIITIQSRDIVCLSDQCLSNYLSFFVFIQKRLLPISNIILWAFPNHQIKVVNFLNVLLNIFHDEKDKELIQDEVQSAWESLSKTGNVRLQKVFCARLCPLNIYNTLHFIDIHVADKEDVFGDVIIDRNDWRIMALSSIISLKTELVLELTDKLLCYSSVAEEEISKIIETKGAIDEYSCLENYRLQKNILSYFLRHLCNANASIAKNYCHSLLQFQSEQTEFDGKTMYIKTISFRSGDQKLCKMRSMAWELLFQCGDFYESVRIYFKHIPQDESAGVFDKDVEKINHWYRKLDNNDPNKELLIYFESLNTFSCLKRTWKYIEEKYSFNLRILKQVLFLSDKKGTIDYKEEETARYSKLKEVVEQIGEDEKWYIIDFLNYFLPISNSFQLWQNATLFIKLVLNKWRVDGILFEKIPKLLSFKKIFSKNCELYHDIIDCLMEAKGVKFAYEYLMESKDDDFKGNVICHFLLTASKKDKGLSINFFFDYLNNFFCPSDYMSLRDIILGEFPLNLTGKFVSKLFYSREKQAPVCFGVLFIQSNNFSSMFNYLIDSNIKLVEGIYIHVLQKERNSYPDYDGTVLSKVVMKDSMFFIRFCEWLLSKESVLDNERKVSMIWNLDCYESLFDDVFKLVLCDKRTSFGFCPLNIFGFRMFTDRQKLTPRQIDWIRHYLTENSDSKVLKLIQIMVWEGDDDTKIEFAKILLDLNVPVSDFKICLSESSAVSYSESYTNVIKKHISLLERIDSIVPESLSHLAHKSLIENHIKSLKEAIDKTLYREAVDDRFDN